MMPFICLAPGRRSLEKFSGKDRVGTYLALDCLRGIDGEMDNLPLSKLRARNFENRNATEANNPETAIPLRNI